MRGEREIVAKRAIHVNVLNACLCVCLGAEIVSIVS